MSLWKLHDCSLVLICFQWFVATTETILTSGPTDKMSVSNLVAIMFEDLNPLMYLFKLHRYSFSLVYHYFQIFYFSCYFYTYSLLIPPIFLLRALIGTCLIISVDLVPQAAVKSILQGQSVWLFMEQCVLHIAQSQFFTNSFIK